MSAGVVVDPESRTVDDGDESVVAVVVLNVDLQLKKSI